MAHDGDVLDRLILAEQDERRRLALFLHDGPLQELAGVALMLDGALNALGAADHAQASDILRTALGLQRSTIRELRDLSFALEPVVLRDRGFEPALRALADQAEQSHAVRVELSLEAAGHIGETASIALYTILRELLEQAIRRGPPSELTVRIESTFDGGLVAIVRDDAEPERRQRSIETIEQRARQLHGTLELRSLEGFSETRVTLPAHTARR